MKYEIAYVSLSGNTEKVAHGIADRFPVKDTIVTDLTHEKCLKKRMCICLVLVLIRE